MNTTSRNNRSAVVVSLLTWVALLALAGMLGAGLGEGRFPPGSVHERHAGEEVC
ncbi:MAG TPA: hypothetical protein VIF09_07610 [Polyangiaceae bacterium]